MEDETWEPEENLANSKEILREFLAQNYLLSSILEGEVSNNEGEGAEDNGRKIQVADKNENEEHISQTKSKASEDKDACNGTEICKFQAKYVRKFLKYFSNFLNKISKKTLDTFASQTPNLYTH